jgi:hypothetical protein
VGKEFSTPHKTPRRKIEIDVGDLDKCIIQRTINEFHTTQDELLTLKSFLAVFKKMFTSSGGKRALRKIIRNLGLMQKKSEINKIVLTKKGDIRAARLAYLRNINRYRTQWYPIIYMDEL